MNVLIIITCIFAMCISLFNYWFQYEKYKRLSKEEISGRNSFNSPQAWLVYFFIFFFALLGIISYYAYKFFIAVMEFQNGQ